MKEEIDAVIVAFDKSLITGDQAKELVFKIFKKRGYSITK